MSRYRNHLPQLDDALYLTDGGLETDLIFHHGANLPCNASYVLLDTAEGRAQLHRYFTEYVDIADRHQLGLVLESPTWRASADWGARIGHTPQQLAEFNRQGVDLLVQIRRGRAAGAAPLVVSGCIGPRSDAYRPTDIMSPEEAERYHAPQLGALNNADVDMASAFTLTNVPEAIGVVRAAAHLELPIAVSFTVETDGRLPTGPSLRDAIEQVDDATDGFAAYFLINCAHPTHFESVLEPGQLWAARLGGLRANSSRKSHAELDESTELDDGNPTELAQQYRDLIGRLPNLKVLGGCCGTDSRHVREIAAACAPR